MPGEANTRTRVYLEVGGKRTFASAADWPGLSRSGKNEEAALAALAAYAPRYAAVARLARVAFPAGAHAFTIVERLQGNATTDFGAPGIPAKDERKPLTAQQAALVEACWTYLDHVVARAPATLRKGPRGGGRDRDEMFDHVLGAEREYAKGIGVRLEQPDGRDTAAVRAFRKAILGGLRSPSADARWPAPYAARRTAWHALDHAWEMEDRTET